MLQINSFTISKAGFTILCFLFTITSSAQTLGGNSVFNFLKLSNTPQLTALGGVNVSHGSADVGLAFNNPGLLRPDMHTQLNAVFNDFYSGIKVYHLSLGYHHAGLNTSFAGGLNYFDYGQVPETDPAGNIIGTFRPVDWVMQVSAARSYLEKWNYGASVKFIYSGYGAYRSTGMAMDVGVVFRDTANLFSASILAKNMGFQMKRYPGTEPDDLPFDLQVGITKRLRDAPFSFSMTAQRLHQFDIRYNDTLFNNENGYPNGSGKKFSFDNLVRHLVAGVTLYLGDHVEVQAGYNFLRRRELSIGNAGNGINGFSLGAGLLFGKLQVRYARAYYQSNTANNQLGLNLKLNEYMGLGKFGKKIGW